uniref:Uncharacterized protein n=1 Tax=Tetranychus urticae TaxID=32264 RepID=T1KS58_TETUR
MEYPVSSSSSSSSPLSASSSRLSPRRAPLHYERTGPTGRRSPSISYVDATGINSFSPSPSGPPLTLTLASSHSASYSSASSHQLTSLSSPSTNITPSPATTTTMATATSSTSSSTASHSKLSPNRSNRSPSVSPVRETGLPVGYINQRRNTLPKHSAQYLSPEARNTGDATVFSRYRSNSYYNRSPSHRRRRSFKEPPATSASANTSPSSSSTITTIVGPYASSAARRVSALEQDTWDSYSALIKSSQDRRKMSLPVSEPISPGWTTKFINVIIVGGPNVGKYSLVRHLVDDENNASKTRVDPNSSLDKSVNVHRLNFPLYDTHIEIIFEYYQNVNKIMDTVTDNGCKVSKSLNEIKNYTK